ncbi:MAG TPA: DUF6617 family protein [Prolixibacteraceae bacterium]|nr:DUF6617 family protein [Prolixibacteraceae bacterium]
MTTKISLRIKTNFDNLFINAEKTSRKQTESNLEIHRFYKLDIHSRIELLKGMIENTHCEMQCMEYKDYIHLTEDRKACYRIYFSHALYFHSNENAILTQSIILSEKLKLLEMLLIEEKAKLPLTDSFEDINNQMPFNPLTNNNTETQFEEILREGKLEGKKEISDFKSSLTACTSNEKKYKKAIYAKLNSIRLELNHLDRWDYYNLLAQEAKLKCYFLNKCFLKVDTEKEFQGLKKCIIMDQIIQFLENELLLIKDCCIPTFKDLQFLNHQMIELFSFMVPDYDIIDKVHIACAVASKDTQSRKPILFIIEDLNDVIIELYKDAAIRLQQLFDSNPSDINVIYAATQVKDIEQLELTALRNGQELNKLHIDLKKIFKIEIDYYSSLSANDVMLDYSETVVKETKQKKLLFGLLKSPEHFSLLMYELQDKIHVFDDRTSMDIFIRIATCDDLSRENVKMYFACKTNVFKYLLEYLEPMFESLNAATIEKSGLFITNKGNPLTATCLYSSKIEKIPSKDIIDAIFRKYC